MERRTLSQNARLRALALLLAAAGIWPVSAAIHPTTILDNVPGTTTVSNLVSVGETDPTVAPWAKKGQPVPGGVTNCVTSAQATNIAANVVVRDVADWALQGRPRPATDLSGITNLVIASALASTNYTDQATGDVVRVLLPLVRERATTNALADAALAATNYADVVTNALASSSEGKYQPKSEWSWARPNDWMVYAAVSNETIVVPGELTVDGYRVLTNELKAVMSRRDGQMRRFTLDPSNTNLPALVEWRSSSPHLTIAADGKFVADQDGLYKAFAYTTNGMRWANVALQPTPISVVTNSAYASDLAGTVRKSVNDAALATLNAATLEGTHTIEGKTFDVYYTFNPHLANIAAGNVAPFAVSPHVLACAHHYGVKVTGPITFNDGTTSATVTRKQWINLRDWALTNGYSSAELDNIRRLSDLDLIICDKATAVPDGCVPYLLPKEKAEQWFGNGMTGVACWFLTRDFDQALPMVMTGYGSWMSSPAYYTYGANGVRKDLLARLTEMGVQNPGRMGDSGRPIFIQKDGKNIVVAHAYSLGTGPDYIGAYPIIKKFVEAYGDTLKEAN